MRTASAAVALVLLAACQPGGSESPEAPAAESGDPAQSVDSARSGDVAVPDPASSEAYDGIGEDETLRFTGTEPFWGGTVTGSALTYSTPENPDGTAITVERFAGRGGLSFSGTLDGAAFTMMVTPRACSDGMSDRTYPFTVTLQIGQDQRSGCGWTDRQRFEGPENP